MLQVSLLLGTLSRMVIPGPNLNTNPEVSVIWAPACKASPSIWRHTVCGYWYWTLLFLVCVLFRKTNTLTNAGHEWVLDSSAWVIVGYRVRVSSACKLHWVVNSARTCIGMPVELTAQLLSLVGSSRLCMIMNGCLPDRHQSVNSQDSKGPYQWTSAMEV